MTDRTLDDKVSSIRRGWETWAKCPPSTRKKPRAVEVDGVLLATCGMALMTLPGATLAMNRGDLLTVCCAACYSAHILTLNRYSAKASFELLATAQIGISALLALSLFRGMETP